MRAPLVLDFSEEQRKALTRISRSRTESVRMVLRAQIVLLRSEGLSKERTARKLGVSEVTVQTWTDRFRESGVDGLSDKPGRGRKPWIDEKTRERIITEATRPQKPSRRKLRDGRLQEAGPKRIDSQKLATKKADSQKPAKTAPSRAAPT